MPPKVHSTEQVFAEAAAARAAKLGRLADCARANPAFFAQYVLKDERSGGEIKLSSTQEMWHDLASEHDRLILWSHVESGKTQQLSIARTLWEIGNDPTLRCAIVSNTHGQATKIIRSIARYIETSPELRHVFPRLKPGPLWTANQLIIDRPTFSKDPTVQAFGVHGAVTGARVDRLIIDDILDVENCRTQQARQQLWEWIQATLLGRLTEQARVIVVGTAYHPEDALHRFARMWGLDRAKRYPVLDDVTGESRWPERWSKDRVEAKRLELGPVEFARQMLCVARDDTEAIFKREWIEVALKRGRGRKMAYGLRSIPSGCKTITGVDLAVQQHASSDETVLFTLLVHPDQTRELLWLDAGRWQGPEIVERIIDTHNRYHSMVWVENNAAQDFILQFTRSRSAVPIRPFTTGRNKAHPEFGVQSIASEMASGKWVIPNDDQGRMSPEVEAWVNEMLYYDPRAHTGDRLMASWFAREGARVSAVKAETGYLNLGVR